jgi:hypothetical protein
MKIFEEHPLLAWWTIVILFLSMGPLIALGVMYYENRHPHPRPQYCECGIGPVPTYGEFR